MNEGLKNTFTHIFANNLWESAESVSGLGSELKHTKNLTQQLLSLITKYKIKSILDIPCGDYNWMRNVDMEGVRYMGADIVERLIENNTRNYPGVDFRALDLTQDPLPRVDLVFVRDCLVHLSNENIFKALENIKKSKSKYLLTTSFPGTNTNADVPDGGWRAINLTLEPFLLTPIETINEKFQSSDKSMVLIKI